MRRPDFPTAAAAIALILAVATPPPPARAQQPPAPPPPAAGTTATPSPTPAEDWELLGQVGTTSLWLQRSSVGPGGGGGTDATLLQDHEPRGEGERRYRSMRARIEIDCARTRWRLIEVFGHADPVGQGAVVLESRPSPQWEPIQPNSVTALARTSVCR